MCVSLQEYFNKNQNKSKFYINNIAEELHVPTSDLVSCLIEFSEKNPSFGFYDQKTGFYTRLDKEPSTLTQKILKILITLLFGLALLFLSPKVIFPFTMMVAFFLLSISAKDLMLYVMTAKANTV